MGLEAPVLSWGVCIRLSSLGSHWLQSLQQTLVRPSSCVQRTVLRSSGSS